MLKKIRHFFKEYRLLAWVVGIITLSLLLDIIGRDSLAHWLLGITASLAVIPLLADMLRTLRSGEYGIDLLAATAIITSVILGEYWAGIIIVLMLTGGEALEDYAESRAKSELSALLNKKPKKAHLIKGKTVTDVRVSAVKAGDKLAIHPGEVIPVDCEIIEGESSIDESSLTGESIPVNRRVGESLLSGSVNIDGALTVKALRKAEDSQYQQIIKMVRSASASKSPFVRLADRYSVPFTIVSFLLAGTVWIISGDPVRFLEVLVVATPCPLLLGAPIALISGMSRSAKYGIIVKSGSALERLAEIETIAFDKTGTLTRGLPVVDSIKTFHGHTKEEVLSYAAALEKSSTHVLANAIVEAAEKDKVKSLKGKQVKELSGQGLSGRLQGKDVLVGRLSLLESKHVILPVSFKADSIKQTATYIAINNELAGVITFTDEIRTETKGMLRNLVKLGVPHSLMVTGDNATVAKTVAKKLGIERVESECLPGDKIAALEAVPEKPVAFVGDGVNDAPVLTAADVGIALGARGSTAASESADVVIMQDDIGKVASSVEIARRTFKIARQSILIGIFISLGLMALFATGRFTAVQGALAQEVVDVIVIINALRAHSKGRNEIALS